MNPIKHLTSSHLSLHPQQILAKFNGLLCNEINQLQLVSIPTIEAVPQWLVRNGGLFFLLALLCQHDLIKFFDEHYLGQVKQYWREKQYRGEYDCVPRLFCTNIVKHQSGIQIMAQHKPPYKHFCLPLQYICKLLLGNDILGQYFETQFTIVKDIFSVSKPQMGPRVCTIIP